MRLLNALSEEVWRQPAILEGFGKSKLPRIPDGSIFVGAGDSYAAALAGFYVSRGRCLAFDPYYLATVPEAAAGKEVVFISASGRTSSNILAAKRVKGVSARTTALTADGTSRLASATDRVVKLPMVPEPRLPGALSLSLSLLAVMKMSGNVGLCDFRRAFARAEKDSGKVAFGKGTTYFLGNSAAHAISLYSAAKVYELLGEKAHSEALEEFSHLELFTLRRLDAVNIYSCFDLIGKGKKLQEALTGRGYKASLIEASGSNDLERLFHAVFVAQVSVLRKAEAAGLGEPRFLRDKGRLGISDAMIY